MEHVKVSVIVPVYKVEKYLDFCLESIVNQSYKNLEIILVDDGSPDRCPEICENWAMRDKRIRVIHKENQGLGMARNTGIEYATGEFICYFDSDDYVDIDTISHAYDAMVQNDADFVVFGYRDVFPDGSTACIPMKLKKTVYSGQEITTELLPWLIQSDRHKEPRCPFAFTAWSGLLRRSILEEYHIRFQSERKIISEDTLYLMEVYSKVKTVTLVPEALYNYRVNPASLTKTYQKDRQTRNNAFLTSAIETATEQGYDKEICIRLTMLYHGFSLEAMKHIVRMKKTYTETKALLIDFLSDPVLKESISKETVLKSSFPMALFLICIKLQLTMFCWLLLILRERNNRY